MEISFHTCSNRIDFGLEFGIFWNLSWFSLDFSLQISLGTISNLRSIEFFRKFQTVCGICNPAVDVYLWFTILKRSIKSLLQAWQTELIEKGINTVRCESRNIMIQQKRVSLSQISIKLHTKRNLVAQQHKDEDWFNYKTIWNRLRNYLDILILLWHFNFSNGLSRLCIVHFRILF